MIASILMGLGDLTKQLVLDSLRPPDLSTIADAIIGTKPPPPSQTDNVAAVIIGQVQAMQKAVKDDEELVVLYNTGVETLRILEIFIPVWRVAVLTGIDTEKLVTRVILPAESLNLTCKVMKPPPDTTPARVRVIAPKA